MRSASRNEIEYLGAMDGLADQDPKLIYELSQRLDALRRFDQNITAAEWRPRSRIRGCQLRAEKRQP